MLSSLAEEPQANSVDYVCEDKVRDQHLNQ